MDVVLISRARCPPSLQAMNPPAGRGFDRFCSRVPGLNLTAADQRALSRRYFPAVTRSEEHTSELQSRGHLVCRLLLEKKKTKLICNKDSRTKLKNNTYVR